MRSFVLGMFVTGVLTIVALYVFFLLVEGEFFSGYYYPGAADFMIQGN